MTMPPYLERSKRIYNSLTSSHQSRSRSLPPKERTVFFQPIFKDGNLYYQPFGILPHEFQPETIVYDGQIYKAAPAAQAEILNQNEEVKIITDPAQAYAKEMASATPTTSDELRNRRTYTEYLKTAEDAQIRAAQLQQATLTCFLFTQTLLLQ
ncbi:unnamed protein product [Gongylonema pulchrum]|uniref:CFAP91 domain-containing protein n=1 Tax=Gongylonema pulchrum TaxID=637853 RepID=A0A183CVW2_9BILA|nr:unnamed protein product [Gongylonema pulchrum]